MFFDLRIDIGEGADRSGDGAGGDFLACGDQPLAVALELGIGLGQFQAEGHRLAMDAVAAAAGRRELVLVGALLDCGE